MFTIGSEVPDRDRLVTLIVGLDRDRHSMGVGSTLAVQAAVRLGEEVSSGVVLAFDSSYPSLVGHWLPDVLEMGGPRPR